MKKKQVFVKLKKLSTKKKISKELKEVGKIYFNSKTGNLIARLPWILTI